MLVGPVQETNTVHGSIMQNQIELKELAIKLRMEMHGCNESDAKNYANAW